MSCKVCQLPALPTEGVVSVQQYQQTTIIFFIGPAHTALAPGCKDIKQKQKGAQVDKVIGKVLENNK